MDQKIGIKIMPAAVGIGWPHGWCAARGDLGCLARHAKAAGYRAQDLAARLAVSSRVLRREFRAAFGITLKHWLVQVRSVEVRRRLLGDESIGEIALAVGFSHAKELSREFCKVYGVTPSVYRSREKARSQIERLEILKPWLLRLAAGS